MITMTRREDGFAEFTDGKYSVAIDRAYNVREKAGVVVDAFLAKSKTKATAADVAAAIEKAGE